MVYSFFLGPTIASTFRGWRLSRYAMIIDSHCHILPPSFPHRHDELVRRDETYAALFPAPGAKMATSESLIQAMDNADVEHSVVVGFGWTDVRLAQEVNDYIIDAVSLYPERLTGFCSVNPAWGATALSEIERCVGAGLKGVGELHPDSQRFDITCYKSMAPVMELIGELGLPVLLHSSEPVGHQYPGKGSTTPDKLYKFVRHFPGNAVICAHWGGGLPFYGLMPEVPGDLANVYFDTAASPFLYSKDIFEVAARTIGPEKILFGTDFPLIGHRRSLNEVKRCGLNASAKSAIMGGNAAGLLGLKAR